MKTYLASIAVVAAMVATCGNSVAQTSDEIRAEMRQVCAPEFAAYQNVPQDPVMSNVIGIVPNRDDREMLSSYRGAILENVIYNRKPRVAGLLSACIYHVRLHQVRNGMGSPMQARDDWEGLLRAVDRLQAELRAKGELPPPPTPTVVAASEEDRGQALVQASMPAAGLSQQQIAACSDEIKRTQVESQRWPGDVNDNAVRLGRFQKELFEGRCAGHPEAAAYIAGANRMLGYANTPSATTGGGPVQQQASASPPSSPSVDRSRQHKIHNPAADAKGCTKLTGTGKLNSIGLGSGWQLTNNCGVTIEAFWCFIEADGRCRRAGTWTIKPGHTWPIQDEGVIHWAACKGAGSGGFDNGSNGERYTCPLLN